MANAKEVEALKALWIAARDKEEELLEKWKAAADDSEEFAKLGVALSKATEDVEETRRDWLEAKAEARAQPTPEEEMDSEPYADWDF